MNTARPRHQHEFRVMTHRFLPAALPSRHCLSHGLRLLLACCCLAVPAVLVLSCSDDPVAPTPYEFADIEQDVLERINAHRAGMSPALPALESNDVIVQEARAHSQAMARGDIPVGHDGFEQRAQRIGTKIAVVRVGENVAMIGGVGSVAALAVQAWLGSQPHRENIEGDYNLTGIGVAQIGSSAYYITQIFVKSQ